MLAPRRIPHVFAAWNAKWRAPFGRRTQYVEPRWRRLNRLDVWRRGLFGFQSNNSTRVVEYPWAFHIAPVVPGLRVLEIGGALSGFQFVLARSGAAVINVDPFVDCGDGPYRMDPPTIHAKLNEYFATNVTLYPCSLPSSSLTPESFDRVYCISTLEHLGDAEIASTVREVFKVLRHGGLFILTVDLFLDLTPFTPRSRNKYGTNISLRKVVDAAAMSLVYGVEEELCGFDGFDPAGILANLGRYFMGDGDPVLTQMLVLQKGVSRDQDSIRRDLFAGPLVDPTSDAGGEER